MNFARNSANLAVNSTNLAKLAVNSVNLTRNLANFATKSVDLFRNSANLIANSAHFARNLTNSVNFARNSANSAVNLANLAVNSTKFGVIFGVIFAFMISLANAGTPSFEHEYEFSLEKDERASVEISEIGFEDSEPKQNFDFYWTLFDTNKIVIHTKFRRFPRQFVLAMQRNLNWMTQTLIPDYTNPHVDRARLILEFSGFDRGEAKLKIYIEDKDSRLNVAFLDPNEMPLNPAFAPQYNKFVPGIAFGTERNASMGETQQQKAYRLWVESRRNAAKQQNAGQNVAP